MKCDEDDVILIDNRVFVDLTSDAIEVLQPRRNSSQIYLKYNDHDYNVWGFVGTPCNIRMRFSFDPVCYVSVRFDHSSKERIISIVNKWCQRITKKRTITCSILIRNWLGTVGDTFTLTGDCKSCPRKFMISVENTKLDKAVVLFSNTLYNIDHTKIKTEIQNLN